MRLEDVTAELRPRSDWEAVDLGLALARHTARAHGGDVRLVSRCGPDRGAAFEARLTGVLNASTSAAGERRG